MPSLRCLPGFLLMAVGLCGCSSGSAVVSGKVTAEGKPVTAGTLILSPRMDDNAFPGRPGVTEVSSDGSYTLTIEPGSNGLAERFSVRFTPAPAQGKSRKNPDAVVPFAGLIPRQAEIDIKPGKNVINIELIEPAPKE